MNNEFALIISLGALSFLPFLIVSGTCYIKFSIVFVIVRNALGLQQVPSNMTLNGVALVLSIFVMTPVIEQAYIYISTSQVNLLDKTSTQRFFDEGLDSYRQYLSKYADPDLVKFFDRAQTAKLRDSLETDQVDTSGKPSIFSLIPAYTLSEIKSAFKIGFYLYLPFVVVDLVISSVLLALGMMMMSPVTISVPVKLVLFVALDGWTLLSQGIIKQYLDLSRIQI